MIITLPQLSSANHLAVQTDVSPEVQLQFSAAVWGVERPTALDAQKEIPIKYILYIGQSQELYIFLKEAVRG